MVPPKARLACENISKFLEMILDTPALFRYSSNYGKDTSHRSLSGARPGQPPRRVPLAGAGGAGRALGRRGGDRARTCSQHADIPLRPAAPRRPRYCLPRRALDDLRRPVRQHAGAARLSQRELLPGRERTYAGGMRAHCPRWEKRKPNSRASDPCVTGERPCHTQSSCQKRQTDWQSCFANIARQEIEERTSRTMNVRELREYGLRCCPPGSIRDRRAYGLDFWVFLTRE